MSLNRAQLGVGARMATLRGQNFRINAPANWHATSETNGAATLAPVGGSGTFGLVYGAVIGSAQADGITDQPLLQLLGAQWISQHHGHEEFRRKERQSGELQGRA